MKTSFCQNIISTKFRLRRTDANNTFQELSLYLQYQKCPGLALIKFYQCLDKRNDTYNTQLKIYTLVKKK